MSFLKFSAHNRDMNKHIPALAAIIITFALFATLVSNFYIKPRTSFAEESQKTIYLTFDDGPSDKVTPKILDVLKEENVPATFFIVGKHAETRKDILRRAYDEGHTLAVHSYTHDYKEIYKSAETLIEDIEKCNNLICSVIGEYTYLYRFPGGSYNIAAEKIRAVKELGYECVDWNASFRDSELKDPTAGKLYTAAISTVSNPDKIIMLAHDTTDKIETVWALKEVIRHFKQQGYKFKKF